MQEMRHPDFLPNGKECKHAHRMKWFRERFKDNWQAKWVSAHRVDSNGNIESSDDDDDDDDDDDHDDEEESVAEKSETEDDDGNSEGDGEEGGGEEDERGEGEEEGEEEEEEQGGNDQAGAGVGPPVVADGSPVVADGQPVAVLHGSLADGRIYCWHCENGRREPDGSDCNNASCGYDGKMVACSDCGEISRKDCGNGRPKCWNPNCSIRSNVIKKKLRHRTIGPSNAQRPSSASANTRNVRPRQGPVARSNSAQPEATQSNSSQPSAQRESARREKRKIPSNLFGLYQCIKMYTAHYRVHEAFWDVVRSTHTRDIKRSFNRLQRAINKYKEVKATPDEIYKLMRTFHHASKRRNGNRHTR